ncbi:hypothetical protein N7489_000857 [Penicillium chrysogenum]|uniref:uncharacterized protein n=1 Tax=Penicillium chrysogenum TaxID=5076 RepID=UPI0024DF161F|nr:uncharacterized protein N7489_000857 [Penicillium chrysogenum]KAJ5250447.1 hypothetical protein N7489_000857 [Penicillium chrysogenum]
MEGWAESYERMNYNYKDDHRPPTVLLVRWFAGSLASASFSCIDQPGCLSVAGGDQWLSWKVQGTSPLWTGRLAIRE